MPSRKQRRRRQKARRHEYEYVYVDEAGREVEAPPEEEKSPRSRDPKQRNGKRGGDASKRPLREPNPPSWGRAARRALLFFPLFFVVFSLVNKNSALVPRIAASLGYSLLFIPLTYVIDRTAYRSFLRRSGRDVGAKR
jgi:hypothetical protein